MDKKKPLLTISFYTKPYLIRMSPRVLDILNYPLYIRLLINEAEKKIAIQACGKENKDSIKIRYKNKSTPVSGVYVNAKTLINRVYSCLNWEDAKRYRIHTRVYDEGVIVFDTEQAIVVSRTTRKHEEKEN